MAGHAHDAVSMNLPDTFLLILSNCRRAVAGRESSDEKLSACYCLTTWCNISLHTVGEKGSHQHIIVRLHGASAAFTLLQEEDSIRMLLFTYMVNKLP